MPTPEERLVTLEQFRTETMRAYADMAYEVTILKGLGEDSIKRLAALGRDVQEVKAQISELDTRVTTRLDDITSQLALVLQKLDEKT